MKRTPHIWWFPVTLVSLLGLTGALPAYGLQGPPPITNLTFGNVTRTIDNIIDNLWVLLVGAAVIFTLIAAFKFLTAQGNAEQVRAASKMLLYAAVALGVGIMARGLVFLVSNVLGTS